MSIKFIKYFKIYFIKEFFKNSNKFIKFFFLLKVDVATNSYLNQFKAFKSKIHHFHKLITSSLLFEYKVWD